MTGKNTMSRLEYVANTIFAQCCERHADLYAEDAVERYYQARIEYEAKGDSL